MATFHPEPLPGSCANGNPEAVCALVVNTTLYDPLYVALGPAWEQYFSRGTQWFTVILSVLMTVWFFYNFYTGHCGWEVIFVTIIELIKIVIEIFWEYETPCMVYSVFGPVTSWLRYIEWLLTCPVILIHLSNLTGLDEEYSARTMELLTSDQGTICFGVTAALSRPGWIKVVTFLTALCFGINTFYTASRVYIESYHQVPKGLCRNLVKYLCGMFFCSWLMFPLLFLAGPEGFNYLTWSGSTIGHTVADLLSKNIWGLIAHYMQVKIREHILIHGDIRKTVEKTVAGHTFEVETFGTEEDDEFEKVEDSPLDRRASFQLIGKRLERQGENIAKLGKEDDEESLKDGGASPMSPGLGAGGNAGMDQNQMMQMMQQMMQMNPQMMGMMNGMQQQPQQAQQPMGGMQQPPQLQTQQSMNTMQGQPMNPMLMNQQSMGGGMQGMNPQMSGQMSPGQMSPGQMSPGGPMQYSQGMMGFNGQQPM